MSWATSTSFLPPSISFLPPFYNLSTGRWFPEGCKNASRGANLPKTHVSYMVCLTFCLRTAEKEIPSCALRCSSSYHHVLNDCSTLAPSKPTLLIRTELPSPKKKSRSHGRISQVKNTVQSSIFQVAPPPIQNSLFTIPPVTLIFIFILVQLLLFLIAPLLNAIFHLDCNAN